MQMIDAGVDALAVFGGDPTAMVDIAKACKDAGIPLFLCALDVDEAGREYATACIGPDQEQAFVDIGQVRRRGQRRRRRLHCGADLRRALPEGLSAP